MSLNDQEDEQGKDKTKWQANAEDSVPLEHVVGQNWVA